MRCYKTSYRAGLMFLAALIGLSVLECVQHRSWQGMLFAALSLSGFVFSSSSIGRRARNSTGTRGYSMPFPCRCPLPTGRCDGRS